MKDWLNDLMVVFMALAMYSPIFLLLFLCFSWFALSLVCLILLRLTFSYIEM